MAQSLQTLAKQLGKVLPQTRVASIVADAGIKKAKSQSIELFGYDFVGLVTKMLVFYGFAFIIAKFFEAALFLSTGFKIVADALGIKIPNADEVPFFIKKLFGEGYNIADLKNIKFWDLVNILMLGILIWEYFRYKKALEASGGSVSPLTTGIFILIIGSMTVMTFPELLRKIKEYQTSFNNPQELR